ncbi:MAG: glycosyltransferase, partial [Cyclobacteriaceae bacterium]
SPNKLFDSLSAGIPIIVNSAGWTKKLVEENNCGAYVDPAKPEEFASLLVKWRSNPAKLKSMGESARELAENIYDKSILLNKFIEVIEMNK